MELLPLIISALTYFAILMAAFLIISYILYKLKSPKLKPYLNMQPVLANEPVVINNGYPVSSVQNIKYYPAEPSKNAAPYKIHRVKESANNINRYQVLNAANSFRYDSY